MTCFILKVIETGGLQFRVWALTSRPMIGINEPYHKLDWLGELAWAAVGGFSQTNFLSEPEENFSSVVGTESLTVA